MEKKKRQKERKKIEREQIKLEASEQDKLSATGQSREREEKKETVN